MSRWAGRARTAPSSGIARFGTRSPDTRPWSSRSECGEQLRCEPPILPQVQAKLTKRAPKSRRRGRRIPRTRQRRSLWRQTRSPVPRAGVRLGRLLPCRRPPTSPQVDPHASRLRGRWARRPEERRARREAPPYLAPSLAVGSPSPEVQCWMCMPHSPGAKEQTSQSRLPRHANPKHETVVDPSSGPLLRSPPLVQNGTGRERWRKE